MILQEKIISNFISLTNNELDSLRGGRKGIVIIDHDELDGIKSDETTNSLADALVHSIAV